MNRADLSYALTATLPHAKAWLGLGGPYIYATDTYTTGIVRIDGDAPTCCLPIGEAKDLAKFVKPARKAHEAEDVRMLLNGAELHVATGDDSAVFETTEGLGVERLFWLVDGLYHLPPDRRELIFQPSFAARFAKAQRTETAALRVFPRLSKRPVDRGVALVTVGDDFIGAIAGLAHDDAPDIVASFLQIAMKEAS